MGWLTDVDWHSVFVPETPILEIAVRGSLVYVRCSPSCASC